MQGSASGRQMQSIEPGAQGRGKAARLDWLRTTRGCPDKEGGQTKLALERESCGSTVELGGEGKGAGE